MKVSTLTNAVEGGQLEGQSGTWNKRAIEDTPYGV